MEDKEKSVNHKVIHQDQDSIELGTPAKGGAVKVYCDFSNIDETKAKISKAIEIRKWANAQINTEL